ncbi:MAG TPA: aminotransferase class IV [Acidimicrobiales bacterium]|nr:aminotransferase class IV [Acidimicrobiales bacterium]
MNVASVGAPAELGVVSWVDGEIVEPGATAFRPEDKGLVGDGVFEAIKVLDGQPFALRRHLERLLVSARPLGLPVDLDVVRAGVAAVLATDVGRGPRSWLRITVTAGPAGMAKGAAPTAPTVMVATAPMAPWGPSANAVVVPWCRNERGALAGLKTLSYLENGLALRHALSHGADEGIFPNTLGNLCEGSGTNVFVAHEGRLVTPPLGAGCLAGVTRGLLLEWLPEIEEADLPVEVLGSCTEAFLTSTSRDVHPIGAIDGRRLPWVPGPLTLRAMAVFADCAARHPDP